MTEEKNKERIESKTEAKTEVKEKALEAVTGGLENVREDVFQGAANFSPAPELPAQTLGVGGFDNVFDTPDPPGPYEHHHYHIKDTPQK